MSNSVTFYTNPQSRGRIIRWMLEEIGQPYKTEILEYGTTMKATDYLAINPMGKVPAIRHGDSVVTEAAAICAYLADAFPESRLAPAVNSPFRGPYFRWLFFAAGPLEMAITVKNMGWAVPPGKEAMLSYGSYEACLAAIEKALQKSEFLAGNSFSAADLYVSSHLAFGMLFNSIEKRPAFERYVSQMHARPASVRAKQIDDALIAERQGHKK